VAATAVGVLLLLSAYGPWGLFFHSTCAQTGPIASEQAWVPVILLNSPYGGMAQGTAYVPSDPDNSSGHIFGWNSSNGSAAWSGFMANVSVLLVKNETAWGFGPNQFCKTGFQTSASPTGSVALGLGLMGSGNTSDAGEPRTLNYTPLPGEVNLRIMNAYAMATGGEVSTCGGPAQTQHARSSQLTTWVPFEYRGLNLTAPLTVVTEQIFTYNFPANFGTWQIDDLSAPGGPGGGWAFSYTPCG